MDTTASWSSDRERIPAEESRQNIFDLPSVSSFSFLKEAGKLFGVRDQKEDSKNDGLASNEYLRHPELEADITKVTKLRLMKDSDSFAPVNNSDGSTTYTLVQVGLTNRKSADFARKNDAADSDYYSRKIHVTVPPEAKNLGDCQFQYGNRQSISEQEFNSILNHDRKRLTELNQDKQSNDVEFYSHGVYTGDKLADTHALLLELSNGRATVNIDWPAYPNIYPDHLNRPNLSVKSYLHYMEDRASAKSAEKALEPLIDKTINTVGASNAVMIGFSHGGMFNARYLRHRVDDGLPKIQTLVLAHPDLPIRSPELRHAHHRLGLLSAAAERAIVVGGQSDTQLRLSKFTPFASGVRLGNDSPRTRRLLQHENAIPITESDRKDPNADQHILNYAGIASILDGGKQRSMAQMQHDYIKASEQARKR